MKEAVRLDLDVVHALPESSCPACGNPSTCCTNVGNTEPPRPGDYTLCAQCGAVCKFGDDYSMVALTGEELGAMDLDMYAHLMSVRKAILDLHARGVSGG